MAFNVMLYFQRNLEIFPALQGKYGQYCKINGSNLSKKNMLDAGYELVNLSVEQMASIKEEVMSKMQSQKDAELRERKKQVIACLDAEPIEISLKEGEICETANLGKTKMADHYRGCGVGTAYVVDNKVVAWHYGFRSIFSPEGSTAFRVQFSSYQICF